MTRAISLSVVVPTFNRRPSLARLLDALAAQTHHPRDFEVVVVDDGSTDDTSAWLRAARTPHSLRLLEQVHAGPAAARNRGVASASGEVVVFFDDDVVPAPDALSVHAAAHRCSVDRVVIGPLLPPAGWRRPSWIRWEEQKLVTQYEAMARGLYSCTHRQFFTGNASLRRDSLLAAGGFDPAFGRAEDVELGYRLAERGMRFVFEPSARVWHYPVRSFAAWRRTPYRYGRADVAMHCDKGHDALALAYREVEGRHPLSRLLVRFCAGSSARSSSTAAALAATVRLADALHLRPLASASLSALFQVEYWSGVRDELAGPRNPWKGPTDERLPRARLSGHADGPPRRIA